MIAAYVFQVEEDEKLKKRKERFGILTGAAAVGAADTEVAFSSFISFNKLGQSEVKFVLHRTMASLANKK